MRRGPRAYTLKASAREISVFRWFRDAGSAHSVHGPSQWPARRFGTLPDSSRDPDLGRDSFRRLLKTHLFTLYAFSVFEMFQDDTLYKLTYLLTYLHRLKTIAANNTGRIYTVRTKNTSQFVFKLSSF